MLDNEVSQKLGREGGLLKQDISRDILDAVELQWREGARGIVRNGDQGAQDLNLVREDEGRKFPKGCHATPIVGRLGSEQADKGVHGVGGRRGRDTCSGKYPELAGGTAGLVGLTE